MDFSVIGMSVADEDSPYLLWFVRVEPQSELRQKDSASMKLKLEYGHCGEIYERSKSIVKRALDKGENNAGTGCTILVTFLELRCSLFLLMGTNAKR